MGPVRACNGRHPPTVNFGCPAWQYAPERIDYALDRYTMELKARTVSRRLMVASPLLLW